jgi:hypothetical protein
MYGLGMTNQEIKGKDKRKGEGGAKVRKGGRRAGDVK